MRATAPSRVWFAYNPCPYPPNPLPLSYNPTLLPLSPTPQPHPLTPPLGKVQSQLQQRETSVFTRRGHGSTFDQKQGLQYAINNCKPLHLLVEEICSHLGGPVLVPVLVCVCVCVSVLVPVPVPSMCHVHVLVHEHVHVPCAM